MFKNKKLITMLTICLVICFSFALLNNDNRINISNNDILTTKQAEAATVTFSDIEVRTIRDTSAIILWHTNIPATGQVEYGLDTSYGNITEIKKHTLWGYYPDPHQYEMDDIGYFHPVKLAELIPGTTYHYRIRAQDLDGSETLSEDYTFTTASQAITPKITGVSPNPTGDTIIDEDTEWIGQTVTCGGNVIVGNTTKTINFTITDSYVTVSGDSGLWDIGIPHPGGGATPVNFTLINSVISFDVTSGSNASWVWCLVDIRPVLDGNKKLTVYSTKAPNTMRIEWRDSTIRGTDDTHLAGGCILAGIDNPWYGEPTIIIDNVNFSYMGALVSGAGYYALSLPPNSVDSSYAKNIMLYHCGKGIAGGNTDRDHITCVWGESCFIGGSDWTYLTGLGSGNTLQHPNDNASVRNSWFFNANTKFNLGRTANTVFENNIVHYAGFNCGDGSNPGDGENNIIRNNVFYNTAMGSRKNGTQFINNTSNRFRTGGSNAIIAPGAWNHLVENNTIRQGDPGIALKPYAYEYAGWTGNHIVRNNRISDSCGGIYIKEQLNVLIIGNIFDNMTDWKTGYMVQPYVIHLEDTSDILFRDNSITNVTGAFSYSEIYDLYFNGNNTNVKFINNKFNESSIYFADTIDKLLQYYYLNVKVEDLEGSPIQGATINITNEVDSDYPAINVDGEDKTSFTTGADGHTPLPSDTENSIAILDYWQNSALKVEMSYIVIASKDGYTNSVTINSNENWYREDPNTYQNTIILVLDMGAEDTSPPYIFFPSPAKNSTNISKDTNITLHIKDDRDGVDQSSIIMIVEGGIVSPIITGTPTDYTLIYNPPTDFGYDQVVDVTIDAQDLASTPNAMNTESYSFTIEPELIEGLVGYWRFNEGEGEIALDSSGNGNDGTINGASWTIDGKLSNALIFDGTDDYVEKSDVISLKPDLVSVAMWVKLSGGAGTARFIVDKGTPSSTGYGYDIEIGTDNKIYFRVRNLGEGWLNYMATTDTYTDNDWHHIVGVYGTDGGYLYVDGVEKDSDPYQGVIGYNTQPLRIGVSSRPIPSAYFNGTIDEVRIYSRALTAAEVLAHYNEGNDTIPPSRSSASPTGILSSGTTSTNISLTTDENATCKYGTLASVPYNNLPNTFSTTRGLSHSQTISGLVDGNSYIYYVRCIDSSNNPNIDDYNISFSISNPEPNHIPIGNLDTATEDSITGWAYDLNAGENPIDVHIYIDGAIDGSATANLNRPDIVGAGDGQVQDPNHGFSYVPEGLSVDDHTVSVYAINQPEETNPELDGSPKTFTVLSSDQTPPTGSILINSGDSKTNSQTVNLTISATDESGLSEMKISETNNFSSATAETYSTIKSFILSIGDGIKTIYIWFKDTIGNWNTSPYSDSIILDSTGPIISNIQSSVTTNSSTITFQTNENSTSYIEYGLTSSYGSQTDSNTNPLLTFAVQLSDLSSDTTYHYRIISEDSLTNSSNSIDKTFKTNQSAVPDSTPPAAITDLESDDITQTSADLEWTSPGDDNNTGTASEYDIRYSTSNITESNWNSAIQITGEPIPQTAGTEQSVYIAVGLSPSTKYYFAIKSSDEVPNISNISNILSFTTLASSGNGGGGGGGGGGTISDTTPPSKPSNFSATGADKQITLKWNNPAESDFVRVLLIKKEDSFPLSKDDGTVLYEGTNQEYTDIELNNNTTYYYSIFAYDKKPNYSEILSISSKPIEGKTSISNGNGKQTYLEGTLIKIPESFKIYVIINNKKKWIPTPEVFETLGYQWTSITEINKTELNNIPNYEDNLIREINNYKVYLIVNGIKRHIPNPEIFLNYGFEWDDVKDVNQETINQYSQNLLIKESKQDKVYYLCPERKIRRWLRSPEIFNSYNNSWEDIQVISKYEMEHYRESNLIKLIGDDKVYLIENNTKRWIKSSEEFKGLGLDWEMVMEVNGVEGSI